MSLCYKHRSPEDEYGLCLYCLSGENPPGMDEIGHGISLRRETPKKGNRKEIKEKWTKTEIPGSENWPSE